MTGDGKTPASGRFGMLSEIASAKRRSPGLFYLALAVVVFLVLYIGVSVSTTAKPNVPERGTSSALEKMTQSMPKTPVRR